MDFTNAEQAMIGQIMRAERTLPDDFWTVAAVQELACALVKLEPLLPDEMIANLIGVGAVLARHGKSEMIAGIEAAMLMARVRAPTPPSPPRP